jgi:hypothetical protein
MQRLRQRLLLAYTAILALLLVALLAVCLYRGFYHDVGARAFGRCAEAAREVIAGQFDRASADLGESHGFSPLGVLLRAPLGVLPEAVAVLLWVVVNVLLVAVLFSGLDRLLGQPFSAEAKLAGFVLGYPFILSDIVEAHGSILVLTVFLCAIGLARRRRSTRGGAVLAAVTPSAPWLSVAIGWTLLRQHRRMLSGWVAGVLVLALAGVAVLGPTTSWEFARLQFSPRAPGVGGHGLGVVAAQVFGDMAGVAHVLVALAIVGLVLATAWRRAPGFHLTWMASEIATVSALAVLLAHEEPAASFVLLWPAAVVGFDAWYRSDGAALRRTGGGAWALAFLLVVVTSLWQDQRFVAWCPLFWAGVLLLVLITYPRFFPRGGRKLAEITPDCGGAAGS